MQPRAPGISSQPVGSGGLHQGSVVKFRHHARTDALRIEPVVQLVAPRGAIGRQQRRGSVQGLGEAAPQMHEDIGRYAASLGIERVLCVGKESQRMYEGVKALAPDCAEYFETQDDLLAALPKLIRNGDVILVKASRGMYLEHTVELLLSLAKN